jgi:hypothetical protein
MVIGTDPTRAGESTGRRQAGELENKAESELAARLIDLRGTADGIPWYIPVTPKS